MLQQQTEEARRLPAHAVGRAGEEKVVRPHQDPAALELMEEIAALHLPLGDPNLGGGTRTGLFGTSRFVAALRSGARVFGIASGNIPWRK